MSARDRVLLKLIAPVAVIAAVWLMILSPKLDDMKTAGKEIDSARAALSLAKTQLVQQKTDQRAERAERRKLAAAGRAVPASLAIPSLLRQLERLARHSGVGLDAITQGGASSDASTTSASAGTTPVGVDATGVSLSLSGRYRNVRRFLTRLDNLVRVSGETIEGTGRLVSISSIAVSPSGSSMLQATVQTTVYTLQDQATVAAATAASAATTTSSPSTSGSASATPAAPAGTGG